MHENDQVVCPITLEAIAGGHAFVHSGTAFDATALYTYLLQAPHMTNPVNRCEFTRSDLHRLETCIERIYGAGCIVHPITQEVAEDTDDFVVLDTQDDEDWFDEVALMDLFSTVVEAHQDNTISLRVDLNFREPIPEEEAGTSTDESESVASGLGSSTGSLLELPPSRVFNSLLDLYDDASRSRRLSDQLQLLSFLDFESVDLVRRMLALSNPAAFHDLVWSNTHVAIMETVMTYLRSEEEETGSDPVAGIVVSEASVTDVLQAPHPSMNMNIQVRYSDDWLVYRRRLQGQLQARHAEIMTDICRLGAIHADTSARSHVTMVREYAASFPDRDVQDTLDFVQRWVTQ